MTNGYIVKFLIVANVLLILIDLSLIVYMVADTDEDDDDDEIDQGSIVIMDIDDYIENEESYGDLKAKLTIKSLLNEQMLVTFDSRIIFGRFIADEINSMEIMLDPAAIQEVDLTLWRYERPNNLTMPLGSYVSITAQIDGQIIDMIEHDLEKNYIF